MSHTTVKGKTTFIHNSDLSGQIEIKNPSGEITVEGNDIIDFFVDYLKKNDIETIESMNSVDYLAAFKHLKKVFGNGQGSK